MPEELEGGVANAGKVIREGDTVLRPAPANAATIHALLKHLAATGFPVPRPLDIRGDIEVLSFIPGEVGLPPYPLWVAEEGILIEVGRTLRSYHEAVGSFSPRPDAVWSHELADPSGGPVICHNDVCIENVVFDAGRIVGLLDFDFAAPGRPVWDLAMTARYWIPLLDPLSAAASSRDHLDPLRRVRLLVDAYGLDVEERKTFTKVLMQIEEVARRFVLNRVERGEEGFVRMWNELGGYERYERKMAWLDQNLERIDEALQKG